MSGDISKLPRWARQHIASLETALREHGDRLAFLDGNRPPSHVEVAQGSGSTPTHSSDDTTVRFMFGDNPNRQDWLDVSLLWSHKAGRVPYAVQLRGSSSLCIALDASNAALVQLFSNAGRVASVVKP